MSVGSASLCGFRLQFANSAYNLWNPLTICGIRSQFAESTYSYGFRDSINLLNTYTIICSWVPQYGSGFHAFCCGFHKVACFWSDFEQYSVLAICTWNPKQQRRSKKNSNVVNSATNLIFACCGICLQFTKCTGWPRNG